MFLLSRSLSFKREIGWFVEKKLLYTDWIQSINECKYFQCDIELETKIFKVVFKETGKIIWTSQRSETDNTKTEKLEMIDAEISINK